jgi:FkbM family methyltransferase
VVEKLRTEVFYSLLYRLLIKKNSFRYRNAFLRKLWESVWDYSLQKYQGPVAIKLHGERIRINNCNPYPIFHYTYSKYNHPLIEIVYQLYQSKKAPLTYIDIGAAIGDTMLLLFHTCPGMIGYYYCIDGDSDFFEYQKYNLRNHPDGRQLLALLSDYDNDHERDLLRTHPGTASSQGNESSDAITLDDLLLSKEKAEKIDLIKIDVDGLDGKVISGSRKLIERFRPHIIFEWHPRLYSETGNRTSVPFTELGNSGYDNFIFFDKLGNFSHFQSGITTSELEFLNSLCTRGKYASDWHYDVIAFPPGTHVDMLEVAEMNYSKKF